MSLPGALEQAESEWTTALYAVEEAAGALLNAAVPESDTSYLECFVGVRDRAGTLVAALAQLDARTRALSRFDEYRA